MTLEESKAIIDALVTLRNSVTDEQALKASALYPKWKVGTDYQKDERVLYDDILYKVLTDHTSQTDWTPDAASSLFAKVLIPDKNVIPEWEQPESTNPYGKGNKVTHNGKTWLSTIDGNVWEPGTVGTESLWEEYQE